MWPIRDARIHSFMFVSESRNYIMANSLRAPSKSAFEPRFEWGFPPKFHLIDREKGTTLLVRAQLVAKVMYGKSCVSLQGSCTRRSPFSASSHTILPYSAGAASSG